MDDKKYIKNQNKDLISRFIFAGILGWMIIGVAMAIINIEFIMPLFSDEKNLFEIFNPKFVLITVFVYIFFQIIIIFSTYNMGITKLIKKSEEILFVKFSKKSLICSLIMCLVFCLIVISRINIVFNTYNISKAINDYSDNYWENFILSEANALQSGKTIMNIMEDNINNVLEISQNNITESNQLLESIIWKFIYGQIFVFAFVVYYNYLFFKKYIKNKEE